MISAETFTNGIDNLTGNVAFSVPLFDIPGPDNLRTNVTLNYASSVQQTVSHWNLTHPTSEVGLGWSLARWKIFVNQAYGTNLSEQQFFLSTPETLTRLNIISVAEDGTQQWSAQQQAFWKITFTPSNNTWLIIDENGTKHTFGTNTGTEVQVAIGDWSASSNQAINQQQVPTTWNRVAVTDLFNNRVQYIYQMVNSSLGNTGSSYTQASYLSQIIGAYGDIVNFTYGDKIADEYAYAFTNPNPPNAYQNQIQTKYLSSVSFQPAAGTSPVAMITLVSDTSFKGGDGRNAAFTKRRLINLTWSHINNRGMPPVTFAYGDNSFILPGALTTVTLPTGGTVSYNYSLAGGNGGVLQYSQRDIALTPPSGQAGVSYSAPELYFENAYTVVTWKGSDNSMALIPYRWEGRWLAYPSTTLANAYAGAKPPLLSLSENLFAVYAGTKVQCFHRDPQTPDGWIVSPVFTPALADGETASSLVTGDLYAALLGDKGSLCRFDFSFNFANLSAAWSAVATSTPLNLNGAIQYAITAQGNSLLISGITAQALAVIFMQRSLNNNAWVSATNQHNWSAGTGSTLTMAMGTAGAVFALSSQYASTDLTYVFVSDWQTLNAQLTLSLSQLQTLNTVVSSTDQVQAEGMCIQVVNNLWRYNGSDWINIDASSGLANGESLTQLSFSEDMAVRTISAGASVSRFDLISFDANTSTWSSKASVNASANSVGVAPRVNNQQSRYALLNNKLYYMNSDLSWSEAAGLSPITVGAAQLASVQVLGSEFLLYQSSATTLACSFLGNGTLISDPLTASGSLLVAGQSADYLVGLASFAAYAGTWDGAGFALTLYRPVSQGISAQQSAITISSVVADAGYAAESVTLPGYTGAVNLDGPVAMAYDFDTTAATCSSDGQTPLFNHLTIYPGSLTATAVSSGKTDSYQFNGLASRGETPVMSAPSNDTDYTNANSYSALTLGSTYQLVASKVEGDTSTTVQQTTQYYWVTLTQVNNSWTVYLSQRKQIDILDGVTQTKTTTYATETGLASAATEDNVAEDGSVIIKTTNYKYFWEVYDTQRTLNILTPIIQKTDSAKKGDDAPVPINSQVTTWKQNWSTVEGWAVNGTYRRTSNSAASFNAWQPGDPLTAGWQKMLTITQRTQTGAILSSTDIASNIQTAIYDKYKRFQVATCNNGSISDFSYYGFESYESSANWVAGSGYYLNNLIISSDSHTGKNCAQLPPGSGNGALLMAFVPSDINASYVFGCWARPLPGFNNADGLANAKLNVNWTESGIAKSHTFTLSLGTAASPWAYCQIVVDMSSAFSEATPDAGSVTAMVILANANTNTAVYVDELRLSPLLAEFEANVYDMDTLLTTAIIDTNGQSSQTIYDDLLRPLVTIGPLESVQSIQTSGFSSQQGAASSFQGNTPNALFEITPGTSSNYDDFRSDSNANWTYTPAGGTWNISGGVLQYSGGTGPGLGGAAVPKASNTENFAAWVQVQPGSGSTAALGDGNVSLLWTPEAGQPDSGQTGIFSLVTVTGSTINTLQQTATMNFASDWLYVAIDGLYYAAVDGVPILAIEQASAPSTGHLTLSASTAASFDNLVRADEPSLTVTFTDGLGREIQNVSIEGRTESQPSEGISVMVSGSFRDSSGRCIVQREPLTAKIGLSDSTGAAPKYLLGTPTEYVVQPNGPSDSLQDYLTTGLADILTYLTDFYESSPLERIVQYFSPRPSSASSGEGYTTIINFASTTSPVPPSTPDDGPDDSPGDFYLKLTETQTETSGGASPTLTTDVQGEITDKSGNILSTYEGPQAGPYLQQLRTYNTQGQLISVTESDGVSSPGPDTAGTPTYQQTFAYDDLLRTIAITGPDAGLVQVMYDSFDRIRFSMDAAGASATVNGSVVQRIKYNRYDVLGRVVESGYIQSASYQWGASLSAKLDDESFPKVAGGGGSGTTIDGVWRVLQTYDTDGIANTQNLLGRLWQSKTQNDNASADSLIIKQFSYDAWGRATRTTETLPWDNTQTVTTGYAYTASGQLASITYPALDSNSISVGYSYDRLGRYAGVGVPVSDTVVVDPTEPVPATAVRYVGYDYDDASRLQQLSFNRPTTPSSTAAFSRHYGYDDDNRLSSITDPYMAISLSYHEQNGADYTGPTLAQFDLKYLISEQWPNPPTALQYQYDYDEYGRVTDSKTASNDSPGDAYGFTSPATGAPGGYDKNGNRKQTTHGQTQYLYHYAGGEGVPENGITSLEPSFNVTQNFDSTSASARSSGPWYWGSNNGGPSTSAISTTAPHTGTQCLKLGGGNSLGHYEQLVLDTFIEPHAALTLGAWFKTSTNYVTGQAFWQLNIYGSYGLMATKRLDGVTAQTLWTQQNTTVDVGDICSALCPANIPVTRCQLMLINASQVAVGSSGAFIYVDDITLQWSSPPTWNISHDPNGNVSALPQRQIALSYDTYVARPLTAQMGAGETQQSVTWSYDSGKLARQKVVSNSTGTTQDQRNYYDLSGNLIARQTIQGGETTTSYYVNGPDGLVAAQTGDDLSFALSDQFGSIRAIIDGTSNQPTATFDFETFGQLLRENGDDVSSVRFMTNEQDQVTGLIIAPDQLYDSELGRYLIAQAQQGSLIPYVADKNNPVNWQYVGAGILGLAALTSAVYFTFPGALTAAAGLAIQGAELAAQYGGYAASAAALSYQLYNNPTDILSGLLGNGASMWTVLPLYQLASLYVPFSGPLTQTILGVGAVAAQGAGAAVFKAGIDSFISPTAMDDQSSYLDHAVRGALFSVAGHAVLNKFDFASAAVTRANYVGAKTQELYLKFPRLDRNRLTDWRSWRAFIVPYKGITSGRQSPLYNVASRHSNHNWNNYGYGIAIPILSTDSRDAILYAEMLLIGIFGQAQHLVATPGHAVGTLQIYTPGTLTPARWQAFKAAFLTRNYQNHFNPGFVIQDWFRQSAYADYSINIPLPSVQWKEVSIG